MNQTINLIRYYTAESLFCKMFEASEEEMRQGSVGGETPDGDELSLSFDEIMKNLKETGCFGFSKKEGNEIHYWRDSECPDEMFIQMIAHEKGHLTGTQLNDDIQEEYRADSFGDAAVFAYKLLRKEKGVA